VDRDGYPVSFEDTLGVSYVPTFARPPKKDLTEVELLLQGTVVAGDVKTIEVPVPK